MSEQTTGKKSIKPNCYKCKYRRDVPVDAHSSCIHPKCKQATIDPIVSILAILSSARGMALPARTGLNVQGNAYGIRNGWFNHPFNFDPAWLEECDGFEELEKEEGDEK